MERMSTLRTLTEHRLYLQLLKMVEMSKTEIILHRLLKELNILGRLDVVQILLKNSADVNAKNNDEEAPIYIAAYEGTQ